ncbi:response regulator transcription factor [Neosynechococcus sphagnicola]|uniref:response regulator transcription factor n=1 Tax=Neosynechococcus sphagnicola TaxID=1501145 RepID=UPI0009DCE0F8|nr:response regulator transcription factor [Neosynechococcus sphagnicola]
MLLAETTKSQATLKLGRVLVVEDEELIRETIALALQEEGYEVVTAVDGRSALSLLSTLEDGRDREGTSAVGGSTSRFGSERLPQRSVGTTLSPIAPTVEARGQQQGSFDVIILDLMLPYINGLDLCRLIRRDGSSVPILILSARGSETDRVVGLEVGADDYLTKPFGMRELVARCRALLRRHRHVSLPAAEAVIRHQDIALSLSECRVTVRGEEINFSPKEFRILELFIRHPRRVWSREQLLERIWGPDFMGDSKTVDVHIRWLREKLEIDPSQPKYLQTVRGLGIDLGSWRDAPIPVLSPQTGCRGQTCS